MDGKIVTFFLELFAELKQFHPINCHVATLDCRSISALQPSSPPAVGCRCVVPCRAPLFLASPCITSVFWSSPQAIILAWEGGEGENRERGTSGAVR